MAIEETPIVCIVCIVCMVCIVCIVCIVLPFRKSGNRSDSHYNRFVPRTGLVHMPSNWKSRLQQIQCQVNMVDTFLHRRTNRSPQDRYCMIQPMPLLCNLKFERPSRYGTTRIYIYIYLHRFLPHKDNNAEILRGRNYQEGIVDNPR